MRRFALVALMILAAIIAPVALPIRMIVVHLRRETSRTEFVVREERRTDLELPQTV